MRQIIALMIIAASLNLFAHEDPKTEVCGDAIQATQGVEHTAMTRGRPNGKEAKLYLAKADLAMKACIANADAARATDVSSMLVLAKRNCDEAARKATINFQARCYMKAAGLALMTIN